MKLPFPEPRPDFLASPLGVSVFSGHVHGDVIAFLHEKEIEGTYFVKLQFSLMPDGIVEELIDGSVIRKEVFRPSNGLELKETIERRIKKFARHYGVSSEEIHYQTWDFNGRKLYGRFELPPAWTDSRILRVIETRYELKVKEEKQAHAHSLCEQAWELLASGRLRIALRQFRDAGQLAPDFHLPLVGIAEVLIRENKCEEARRQLEQAAHHLGKSRGLTSKGRHKETKRIEEALGRLNQKQLEAQKVLRTSSAGAAFGLDRFAALPSETLPIKISFSVGEAPSPLLEKYKREEFEPLGFYHLRLDAERLLRNSQTLAWKFVNQLKKKYLLLLTATPIHNDLEELYNLITLLRPGQLGTPAQFKSDFADRGNTRKPKNMERLRPLLREVMIRNTRASAAVKLPRRIARTISIDFTDTEMDLYQQISGLVRDMALERGRASRFLLTILQREAGSSLRAVLPTLKKLRTILSANLGSRLEEIVRGIQSVPEASKLSALHPILTHSSEKCLIFTEFLETQAYLAESLTKMGQRVGIFNGSLTPQEKTNALREFEEQGRILILTPSGGEGTNLQFCRTLVNYDLPWNPMKIEQRIGRIHRIGQTGEVMIYNLAAKQTVEHYLLKILDEKLNLFELVVGEAETILGEFTEEKDFEEILMGIWLEAANFKDLELKINDLGNRILEEKAKYLETKQFDDALFKQDYESV